jgi:hypothetical protein
VVDADCTNQQTCAVNVCNAGHCSHYFEENCCGNFVCEIEGEETVNTCSRDCELITIGTSSCNNCSTSFGTMFTLQSAKDIIIKGLTVPIINATNNDTNFVLVYTAPGSFSDKAEDLSQWTQIYANAFARLGESNLFNFHAYLSFLRAYRFLLSKINRLFFWTLGAVYCYQDSCDHFMLRLLVDS